MKNIYRLDDFIREMNGSVFSAGVSESARLTLATAALQALVARDDWLPPTMAEDHPEHYCQHLLYCDPDRRYSLISAVWWPGQGTPVHDHLTWGVVGMLRGAEWSQHYSVGDGAPCPIGEPELLEPGKFTTVSPQSRDIHRVWNAYSDRVSISIHLYGGDIGSIERHVFDSATGAKKSFVSGYGNCLELDL